jgi:hypothetical protein
MRYTVNIISQVAFDVIFEVESDSEDKAKALGKELWLEHRDNIVRGCNFLGGGVKFIGPWIEIDDLPIIEVKPVAAEEVTK